MNIKLINREEGKKALDDGFCVAFGEKHRTLFEETGEKLIEIGMKNAEDWCHNLLFYKADRLSTFFEMAEDGIFEKEKIDSIVKGLKVFFSDEEIEKIKKHPERYDEYAGAFSKGRNEYEAIFVKEIDKKDVTLKSPKPFDYFKQFGLSDQKQFKSVTLHGEGGLGLDQYTPSTMKFYKEEGELFYPIEAVGRKYHYFGMLLKQQEVLLYWVDKILKNMTHETNYFVQSYLKNIIYEFSLDSVSDEIMLYIQNELNLSDEKNGFRTHKQIRESLKNIGKGLK